jgi:hypothetical protein
MDRAMADAMRDDPELFELLRTKEAWRRAQSEHTVDFQEVEGQSSHYVKLTKEDLWLRYQDALARRSDAQRAQEVAATMALAEANTRLARQQLWLAIAITVATAVQAVAAVIALCRGSR